MYKERIVLQVGMTVEYTDGLDYEITNIQRDCYNSIDVTIERDGQTTIASQGDLVIK